MNLIQQIKAKYNCESINGDGLKIEVEGKTFEVYPDGDSVVIWRKFEDINLSGYKKGKPIRTVENFIKKNS